MANPELLQKAFELHRAGQLDEAERLYRQLVAAEPRNAQAWHLLGVAAQQQGRHAEAIECIGRAIEFEPGQFLFHLNLSTVYAAQGRADDAIAALREVVRLEPKHAMAHNDLGILLADQGRFDEAAACFRTALAWQPDFAPAHNNLGKTLDHQGRPQEAIECFREAIRLDPNYATAYNGLGVALEASRRPDEAMAAYEQALAIHGDDAEAHNNIGQLLVQRGEFAAARARFDRAAEIQPGLPAACNNRGMLDLLEGDFVHGWPRYEARLQLPTAPQAPPGPAWNGEPLAGRTILLYTEQGLGDVLQFIRYAPLVKARGGRVVVVCPKRLIPILSTCPGIDEFVGQDEPPPPFDVQAALLSVPGILGTDAGSIPADVPYLSARADLVESWRAKLPADGRLRVGINWQGSPTYRFDDRRSIPLAEFAPLAQVEGVRLVSLQKGFGIEQLGDAPFEVEDLGSRLDEGEAAFGDTAAVIKNLDLVITSDTAVAHLAGALAAPVWVALPRVADWRWLLNRRDSPWYPTMRLFRQQAPGQWKDVFETMAHALGELAAGKSNLLPRAVELHQAGRLDEAERIYRRVLAAEPNNADALQLLGVIAHQQGRHALAIEQISRAIALDPHKATFHLNLATAHAAQGRREEAIASMSEAIRLEPNHVQALHDLGALLATSDRLKEAVACFRRALAIQPGFVPALVHLGNTLKRQGQPDEALEYLREAVRLDPGDASAHVALGAAFYAGRRPKEAWAAYERALAIDSNCAEAHNNIGHLLLDRGEFAAARARLDEAQRIQPDLPYVHNNYGSISVMLGRYEEARAHIDRSLAIDPNFTRGHFSRATLALLLGDYAGGWPEYEWRLQLPEAPMCPPAVAWKGEPLEGRTILLYTEQGLGDILQFIRYAPLVKARGGRVIVGCAKRLVPILSTCAGIDQFLTEVDPLPPFDLQAALLSLPGILGTDAGSIPADVPYLSVGAELVERWQQELPHDGRLRVGINWQGSRGHRDDHRRSILLSQFAPLARVEGVRLVSLQKGFGSEQLADFPFQVQELGSRLDEGEAAFCDTAAVIKSLDLVITCDTSVAHLAGALGAPVWVALPHVPDWRWLLDREDSPWYPTMRLFRQAEHGQWTPVFERIADCLNELAR